MSHTEQMREAPEIVARVMRYAGQTMRTARNPNITARECIELADWIKAALTAAKAGGWLPIETAPKDGTRILVWRKHATRPLIARYQKDFEWFEDEDGVHLYHLIYWQPLPNPPKEKA